MDVQFTDLSTGFIIAWLWDFDDGGTSTLQNPLHNFASDTVYNVRLDVYGAFGTHDFVVMPVDLTDRYTETYQAIY